MRLISFDIGIKNLAYCVFDVASNGLDALEVLDVVEWKAVNLLDDGNGEANSCVCNCVVESKKKARASEASTKPNGAAALCGRKAKYMKNSNTYFCETHAKSNKQYLLPKKEHSLAFLKKQKLDALVKIYESTLLGVSGENRTKNMKKSDYVDALGAHYAKICLEPITQKKQNAGTADLISIGRAIQKHLDANIDANAITHVIIENQISTIATRMKTIQGMITQYFISKPNGEAMVIEYISSSNKLKGLVSPPPPPPPSAGGRAPVTNGAASVTTVVNPEYKKHKQDGVAITKQFVNANYNLGKWGELFVSKKKDDLADCFLQGIWYLKSHNIISYTENLEINNVFLS